VHAGKIRKRHAVALPHRDKMKQVNVWDVPDFLNRYKRVSSTVPPRSAAADDDDYRWNGPNQILAKYNHLC
jgi:hypothetical protein